MNQHNQMNHSGRRTDTDNMQPYPSYKPSNIDWIGEIPSHWEIKGFKYIFYLEKGLTITKDNLTDEGILCVNYGEIHSKYGFELNTDIHKLKYVNSDYLETNPNSLLNQGDFIFADTSEDIEGSGNFTFLSSNKPVFAGYHTIIARPSFKTSSKFLAYELDSLDFRNQIKIRVKGVKVFSITQTILKELLLWLPPLPEQQAIVSYLDEKTALIDELILKKERKIELLKEQRIALINHAVTKGLNDEVEMKDSGIEWIGDVPEHWGVKKLNYVAKINSGATPDRSNPNYWDGEIPWIKTGEVDYNIIYSAEEYITDEGYKNSSTKLAPTGTLLMAMYGQGVTRGRVALLGVPATYNQACCAILFSEYVNNKFGFFFFKMAYEYIRDDGNETSQMNISTGYISSLKILVPPIPEQQAIAAYLDEQTTLIDKSIALESQKIEKLKEYRQSLISAVVTGKVCVLD